MSVWNKVMLPMIVILAIFATFWAAQELKIESEWGKAIAGLETAQEKTEQSISRLMNNADELPKWEAREYALVSDVAENWRGCDPVAVQNNDGQVSVNFTLATPGASGMNTGDVIYIFDERAVQDGGGYLGRFHLAQINDNKVDAVSFDILEPREIERLQQSFQDKAKWSVHSKTPTDRPDFFESMNDSERSKYLPEKVLELYTKEYQPVDFGLLLATYYRYRVELREQLLSAQNEYRSMLESQEIADKQLRELRNEIDETNRQIKDMDAQREEVGSLTQQLNTLVVDLQTQSEKVQLHNEKLLLEIERLQREALKKMRE
ncbi:MAG: hypothetical protein ACRC10_10280 [Thermoguttaceae bacterium]